MATRWAIATGNWSDSAIWNGGVLPTIGDIVHADGKTVTIDQSINVDSIRTTNRGGGISDGAFKAISGGITIQATTYANSYACLTTSHATGTITIIGNQNGGIGNYSYGLLNTGAGALIIIGNQNGGIGNDAHGFYNTGSGNIQITGSQYGNLATNATGNGFRNFGVSSIQITGNQYGGNNLLNAGFYNVSGSFVIVGNQIAAAAPGVANSSAGVTLQITGQAYASSTVAAINNQTTSLLKFKGKAYNNLGVLAINTVKLYYDIDANSEWQFNDFTTAVKSLYGAGATIGQPIPSDVRYNTVYGANNDLVGTCHVPPKEATVAGVPCDDGVGTFGFTTELITRLQNCATVESVGEQLEALSN